MMAKAKHKTDVEEWLDTLDPETTPGRDARHLREVGKALTALEEAEKNLEEAVRAAHEAGDSWAAISSVLGTSRQAAHRKYAQPRTK